MAVVSLFSGGGGFDKGFELAGFDISVQCEIDPKAQLLLRRHHPNARLYSDVRKINANEFDRPNGIIGGFPCQDVSVAGQRGGLAGERSGLWWEFSRIIDESEPEWVVIENVPGLLSSNGGRDFGAILGWLEKRGYWWAYRVLDSQYFGVPQRRRRVFIVASLRKGLPQAVLFEPESSPWDIAPSRGERQDDSAIAGTLSANGGGLNRPAGNANELDFCIPAYSVRTANTSSNGWGIQEDVTHTLDGANGMAVAFGGNNQKPLNVATSCNVKPRYDFESETLIAATLRSGGNGGVPSSRGEHLVIAPTLSTKNEVASSSSQREAWYLQSAEMFGAVRRLTPLECERLQGFPDGWTEWGIDEAGEKVMLPDTQRYKILGNAVTVNVAEWIGKQLMIALAPTQPTESDISVS